MVVQAVYTLDKRERGEKTAAVRTIVTFNLCKKDERENHLILHNVLIIYTLVTN